MKKNLIFSIVSLCLASALIIFISFAWFISNAQVKGQITHVNVVGDSCSVTLEQYEPGTGWAMKETLKFENIEPGDTYFFRIGCSSSSSSELPVKATIGGFATKIASALTVEGDMVQYQGIDVFTIDTAEDGTKTVTVGGAIVYDVVDDKLVIRDEFKIENAFRVYSLGVQEEDYIPTLDDAKNEGQRFEKDLNILDPSCKAKPNDLTYCVFGIKYLDFDSSAGGEYESNNCFSYQVMHIDEINVYFS